jgi:hypothetical protein
MFNEYTIQKTKSHAASLIKDGMRIALVHSITGISRHNLLDMHKAVVGKDTAPAGRIPSDTIAYIKLGQSPLALATVVSVYLSAEKEHKSPVDAFMVAWEAARLFTEGVTAIDINAAWYAVRDVKSGLISWGYCKNCKAGYLLDTKQTKKTDICPYCGTQDQKKLEVTQ